jgi:hypothetical protein
LPPGTLTSIHPHRGDENAFIFVVLVGGRTDSSKDSIHSFFIFVFVLVALEVVVIGVVGDVQIGRSEVAMVHSGVVLGRVVGPVEFALPPEDVELFLEDTITYPVETHIHCFLLWTDVV